MTNTTTTLTRIPDFDSQIEHDNIVSPAALVVGYWDSRQKGRNFLVLNDWSMFPEHVPAIVRSMQGHGIRKVALVDRSTALRDILWAFHEAGATVEMALIDLGESPWEDERETSPGFLISL